MRQAEDRAHRKGQRLPVNVYFLCAKGTTDERYLLLTGRPAARRVPLVVGVGWRYDWGRGKMGMRRE